MLVVSLRRSGRWKTPRNTLLDCTLSDNQDRVYLGNAADRDAHDSAKARLAVTYLAHRDPSLALSIHSI